VAEKDIPIVVQTQQLSVDQNKPEEAPSPPCETPITFIADEEQPVPTPDLQEPTSLDASVFANQDLGVGKGIDEPNISVEAITHSESAIVRLCNIATLHPSRQLNFVPT